MLEQCIFGEQIKMYKEKIVNAQTGEETWRDYTSEEIAQVERAQAEAAERAAKAAEAATARQALLAKLGITEEEARLLLGGN
jgi:acyl-CoA reductase-like NAD-dependent aldehyde dehydrogenase